MVASQMAPQDSLFPPLPVHSAATRSSTGRSPPFSTAFLKSLPVSSTTKYAPSSWPHDDIFSQNQARAEEIRAAPPISSSVDGGQTNLLSVMLCGWLTKNERQARVFLRPIVDHTRADRRPLFWASRGNWVL
jgi:hypothetical protein